jgi:hypothetical protein
MTEVAKTVGFNMPVGSLPKLKIKDNTSKNLQRFVTRNAQEKKKEEDFRIHKAALTRNNEEKPEFNRVELPAELGVNPAVGEDTLAPIITQKGVKGGRPNPKYLAYKRKLKRMNSANSEQQFVQVSPEKFDDPVQVTGGSEVPGKPELLPGYQIPTAPEPVKPPKGAGTRGGLTRQQRTAHNRALAQQQREHQEKVAQVVDAAHEEANNLRTMRAVNATNRLRNNSVASVQSPPLSRQF